MQPEWLGGGAGVGEHCMLGVGVGSGRAFHAAPSTSANGAQALELVTVLWIHFSFRLLLPHEGLRPYSQHILISPVFTFLFEGSLCFESLRSFLFILSSLPPLPRPTFS